MELHFFHTKTIGDVKRQFARNFPYLKLEFFTQPHVSNEGSLLQQRLDFDLTLADAGLLRHEGVLKFEPSVTVTEFENSLQTEFGLPVQVFRNACGLWLETVNTDNLSLEKQNSLGEAACRPIRVNLATLFL